MPRRRALRMLAAGAGVALVGGLRPAVARAEGCGDQAANCQRQGKDFCGGERLAGCLYTCCDPGEECCTASDRYGVVGAGCCPVDTRCGDGGYPGCVCKIPCDPEGRRCCSVKDQEVCMPSTEANEGQVCCPPERRCNEKCCPEGEECIRGECTPYCRNERGRGVTRVYDPKTECCTEHGIEQKYPIRNYARCRKTRVRARGTSQRARPRGPDDGPEVPQGYGPPASAPPAGLTTSATTPAAAIGAVRREVRQAGQARVHKHVSDARSQPLSMPEGADSDAGRRARQHLLRRRAVEACQCCPDGLSGRPANSLSPPPPPQPHPLLARLEYPRCETSDPMAKDRLKTLEERTRYEPGDVEPRVFARWEQAGIFHPDPEGTPSENFSIAVPPPNVTGNLHMGHALNASIQDLKIRVARMRGQRAKWIYGKDHAGIATQRVVEQQLQAEGSSRVEIGREAFVERVWEWVQEYGDNITRQFRELGASLDYEDERFTMDEDYVRAVTKVFVHLYEKGLVYRDNYMVNWDPGLRTAISDLEVEQRTVEDTLYMIDYPLESGSGSVTIATVRPETMLADTAIAVNPADERYSRLIGEAAVLPLVGRRLPIIADDYVDPEFGTGALKITPGHDQSDFDIGRRHGLEEITVIGEDGLITDAAPERFRGMETADALKAVVAELREEGLISGTQAYVHDVPHSHRSGRRVEPLISLQWFCDMDKLARPAIDVVKDGTIKFHPGEALDGRVPELAREHPAVVHFAAALVGPPAAGLVPRRGDLRGRECPGRRGLGARSRRARHVVLLGPLAVRHARLAERHRGAARVLPDRRATPRRATSSSSGWRAW